MKHIFYSGIVAVALVFSCSLTAKANGVFDMFTVRNDTCATIHYQVQWDGGCWTNGCVPPHGSWNHWFEEKCSGHRVQIRFDRGGNTGNINYSLDVYRGVDTCQGASYTFRYNGAFLDLTKDN